MPIYVEPVRPDFWQLAKSSPTGEYIDRWGPLDCMTHSAARNIMRALEGQKPANLPAGTAWPPNGEFIRSVARNPDGSLDRSGGTNHNQMAAIAERWYGVTLINYYNLAWDSFLDLAEESRGWGLSIGYGPVADSSYDAGHGFRANHEIFGSSIRRATGWADNVVDPLAGPTTRTSIFHGPGSYPLSLLKTAAGKLNVSADPTKYVPLGFGRAYVSFTPRTGAAPVVGTATGSIAVHKGSYNTYKVVNGRAVLVGSFSTGGFPSAPVHLFKAIQSDGTGTTTLLKILSGAHAGLVLYRYAPGITYTAG